MCREHQTSHGKAWDSRRCEIYFSISFRAKTFPTQLIGTWNRDISSKINLFTTLANFNMTLVSNDLVRANF